MGVFDGLDVEMDTSRTAVDEDNPWRMMESVDSAPKEQPKMPDTGIADAFNDEESGSPFTKYVTDSVNEWYDAMRLGYQESIFGMLNRKTADVDDDLKNRKLSLMGMFFHGIGQTPDLPYFGIGYLLGGATPVTGAGGAMALPAAIKKVYIDRMRLGEVKNGRDFAVRAGSALKDTAKSWLAGASGGAAGGAPAAAIQKAVALGYKVPIEAITMTAVSSALEGQLPTSDDFAQTAMTLLAMHIGGSVKAAPGLAKKGIKEFDKMNKKRYRDDIETIKDNLMDYYAETGSLPSETYMAAQKNNAILEQMLSRKQLNPKPSRELGESDVGARIGERVVDSKTAGKRTLKERIEKKKDQAITDLVNEVHPLNKWIEDLVGGKKNIRKLAAVDNPAKLAQLANGLAGKVTHFYEFGGYDVNTLKRTTRAYKDILKMPEAELDVFRNYAVAKRAIEIESQGKVSGFEHQNKKIYTKRLDAKYEKTLLELVDFQNASLKQMADVGIITQKSYDAMVSKGKYHIPFDRYWQKDASTPTFQLSAGLAAINPVKAMKGGNQKIYDPLETIMLRTMENLSAVENQRIAASIIDLTTAFDFGNKFLQQVGEPKILKTKDFKKVLDIDRTTGRQGFFAKEEGTIAYFKDGKRLTYKIDKEISDLIKTIGVSNIGTVAKLLKPFASTLRAGATLSPTFGAKNATRDAVMSYVTSKNTGWIPRLGIDIAGQLFSKQKKTKLYQEFLMGGGANSTLIAIDRPSIRKSITNDIRRTKFQNTVAKLAPLKMLRDFSEHIELSTRMAEFKLTKKRLGGKSDFKTTAESAFEAREITLDFARTGKRTKAMNQTTAFFNATVQGHSKVFRTFSESPIAALKLGVAIVVPSMLIALKNHGDPDIKEVPKVQRDLFWVTKLTNGIIVRIPKPHELGAAGSIVERAMEYMLDDDPNAFNDLASSLLGLAMPNLLPTALQPVVESYTNFNFFRGRRLVSVGNEGKLPEYMYTQHTSEVAKSFSQILAQIPGIRDLGVARSPIGIENMANAWTGTLGKLALTAIDKMAKESGLVTDSIKPTQNWTEYPIARSFFVRHPSMTAESIARFYDRYEEGQKIMRSVNGLIGELKFDQVTNLMNESDFNTLTGIKTSMGEIRKTMNLLMAIGHVDGIARDDLDDYKRENMDLLINAQITLARGGNTIFNAIQKAKKQSTEKEEEEEQKGIFE